MLKTDIIKSFVYPLFVHCNIVRPLGGAMVTDIAAGYDHIASAIGAAISAAEGVDLLCYLTPSEHLALPTADEVKEGLIAYRIAAHVGDLVKKRQSSGIWKLQKHDEP